MASAMPVRFSPKALARPHTRNPNKPTKLPSKSHNNNRRRKLPQPPSLSTTGGDATTYTRLPPKDDFVLPSFDPPHHPSAEVTLSEFHAAARKTSGDVIDSEDDESDGDLGFQYGKFELFEVNSDDEDEAEDEYEEDYGLKLVGIALNSFQVIPAILATLATFCEHSIMGLCPERDFRGYVVAKKSHVPPKIAFRTPHRERISQKVAVVAKTVAGIPEEKRTLALTGFEEGEAGSEGEEAREKEKGVPAVMRCFDRAKIFVKGGDGGNGVVAFRREKYVPMGGPSGGNGGRGGNIYLEVDGSMNSLLPFRQKVHFWGGRGGHGQGRKMNGSMGEDVVVKVAPGTVIREAVEGERGKGEVLFELLYPGQRALLLRGGRGGRGNAAFKTGDNKVPRIAENGEKGPEMWLELELKLVADVGIIGAPNAGKSTLLSVVSAAQPAIANYPYTTLLPNLGVVSFDYDSSMVVADLPGLLEGAHRGFGLGHEFLRHTERCSALVHVIDGSSQQPEYEFDAVRLELELFNPELVDKPYLVAYNKMDLPEASERWSTFKKKLQALGIEPFCMSAVKSEGTHEVISAAYELVRKGIEDNKEGGWTDPVNLNYVADMVEKQRTAPIDQFEILHDSGTNTWNVDGAGLRRFVQMTNWQYMDSERRFQHVLEACGVYKALANRGVKEGDTVIVGEMELVWHDSADGSPSNLKKGSTHSIRWPQWK